MDSTSVLKVPPHNMEAEEAALGAILIGGADTVARAQELLRPDEFYRPAHAIIFAQILDLAQRNQPVDIITLTDRLRAQSLLEKAGGAAAITSLAAQVPSSANFEHYARIVREKAMLRALIGAGSRIVEMGFEGLDPDEALNTAESEIYRLAQRQSSREFRPMSELVTETFRQIEIMSERSGVVLGVPTGFRDLDTLTSGFQPSDLIIIAARPSMGKTAFALNLAGNIAIRAERPVAFFSLEMGAEQLAMRMLCTEARLSSQNIRQGHVKSADWSRISLACGVLSRAPVYIDDTPGISYAELRSKARRLHAEKNLGIIFIDYLQLMSGSSSSKNESRQQEVSEISRNLKALARELRVPLVALSQLSRQVESRHDKRPMLSDLRESGAIEQDADIVVFLYRDEYYNREDSDERGVSEVIIAKHRNGPVGVVKLAFNTEETRFADLAMMEPGY